MGTRIKKDVSARNFAAIWKNRGDEKSDTQQFWMSLLQSVFGVAEPQNFIEFEKRVQLKHVSFIDAYIDSTKVLIEQKSSDVDLHKGYRQSDGSMLTPFQQAKRYANEMPYSSRPRWVVVCNFRSFLVYDMETPNAEPFEVLLENFEKDYFRLSFLVNTENVHLKKEMEVSIKAGEIVGKIYDALLEQYKDATNVETLKSLNILCVRLVFCLYAEDAGIFGSRCMFHDYLSRYSARDMRRALIDLFKVLDTKREERDPYLEDELAAFPYVNGGLFSNSDIEIPQFTDDLRTLILDKASDDFDWSEISPTIFGAVFESTLNPETRRSGGMHYTSIENIHKVIDPLFLDDLRSELDEIKNEKTGKIQNKKASDFQDKLASLRFLDPACGSGNFLTETYLSLRRLENEAISIQTKGQSRLGFEETNPIKVSIHQFYGIEINDFAVATATTALWIAENQMLKETESIVDFDIDMLPLKTYHNIKEGNALKFSWTKWEVEKDKNIIIAGKTNLYAIANKPAGMVSEPVVKYNEIDLYTDEVKINPSEPTKETYHVDFDYIMGNPPFVGHQYRSKSQIEDMNQVFRNFGNCGKLDYVAAWYKKAVNIMQNTRTRAAFVSTNSISQGESVALLWQPLFEKYNFEIIFAYRTFRWNSESNQKAHVHCVIVGFCCFPYNGNKLIYNSDNQFSIVQNINGYLFDAPNVFIQGRGKSLSGMPEMTKGSQPTDGGNLLLSEEEKNEMLKKYPQCEKFIKRFVGADDFINNKVRYCLWLKNISPEEYRNISPIHDRLLRIKELRLKSPTKSVQKDADTPMLFTQIRQPESEYLAIPETSSESRKYIPIGFMSQNVICSNAIRIIPKANKYLFGILTSNVHMAWMRVVCGRLKSDYRYSPAIYNNFPWPTPSSEQKLKIEQTAQAILDARNLFPKSSLADLYDEVTMPPELRKAHQENDKAVMAAYGFPVKMTENECVAALFKLYAHIAIE